MSIVEFRGDYMRIVGDSLNLAEFWLVFTDLRWISLACMALSPSITTRGIEGARFLPTVGDLCLCLACQLLTERNEKAGWCAFLNSGSLAFTTLDVFSLLLFSNLIHFLNEVRLLLLSQKQAVVIVILFLVFLGEVEFFLIAGGIIEAEMLRYGAFASSRDHWKRGAKLPIEIFF